MTSIKETNELDGVDHLFSDDELMGEMDDEFAKVNIQTSGLYNSFIGHESENTVFLYRMFYSSLFPYKPYFYWLNQDTIPTRNFTHREFSFTLPSDIYIRYKSFNGIDDLKKEIERIQPTKIDIGAIYSIKPNLKKTVPEKAFKPVEKEFVLDIDMTDYDDIRTCCSGGDICHLCWEFMTVAIKTVHAALQEDFGYKHIMWVYSGRRGVHCWVSDERARKLSNEGRKAVINFLNVVKDSAQKARRVRLNVLHPSLKRSFDIISQHFDHLILENMGILNTEERCRKVLDMIPDGHAKEKTEKMWLDHPERSTAQEKWDYMNEMVEKIENKKRFKNNVGRDIMFQYTYPRLDVGVSTNLNHLLKSPFCVHPKTLKVCVPIPIEDCERFDPLSVPTLSSLNDEIYAYNNNPTTDKNVADYKKTSLAPYIEYFDKYAKSIMLQTKREKRDEDSMEF
ncbi:Putative DNA primase [Rhizopus microsporus]|nr:Putative DNA primase [Rhizopus microsporus]